jgi:phenylacetate-coenzyme A ligase PaaK-like adenylate-forming protein
MSAIDKLFQTEQYTIPRVNRDRLLVSELNTLTKFHYNNCLPYKNILDHLGYKINRKQKEIADFPFIPVRLFKSKIIQSVPDSEVLKVLTSSGTTSQAVSRIALNRETAVHQVKALAQIITSFIGHKRLPMIIIDTDAIIKNKSSMNARGAGLVGLSNFGRNHFYALDENMNLKVNELKEFIAKFGTESILIFGFTYMVWQYFYGECKKNNIRFKIPHSILIHSGGWKKLIELSVSNKVFKNELQDYFGIKQIYNFYGMVEQVGSIYMECEHGYLHTPNFAEIIIRDYHDWKVLPHGEKGIIQTLSILPRSYPGHSLLTEDIGHTIGVDNCPCGRKGTYFLIEGRIPKAEIRGCSDTHAETINTMDMVV